MNLIEILEKTVSSDKNELETTQKYLEQATQQNLPGLLKELSDILKHGSNSNVARMQAAIQLKNALYSKDPSIHQNYSHRWLAFPEELRNYIKQNVLDTLGSEVMRPSSAAQCVAYIACTELPHGLWMDLMGLLCDNVTKLDSSEMMKESSLEAIGYICQDIDPEHLANLSNGILTAIVHGMKKEEPSNHVRLAATNALLNSLEFTKANFEVETERHFIMQVVCEATQSTETQVRVVALQCLVRVMSLYYQYMEHYMGPALFAITLEATKSAIEQVSLQGIEFWSTVCDEEVDLAIEASEAAEQGRPPERSCHYYAKGALQYLVVILTHTLAKQEEYDDDDEWNPCKAAGVCLMLLATCCEDAVVPHVLPFVTEHIKNLDWKYRDAAIMAFGSILEGPRPETLKPIVEQAMPTLIELLKDPSIAIRDTSAWTVGRICEIIPEAVINDNYLNPLLCAMVEGLSAAPRVASNVCWAFSSLVEAAYESVEREGGVVETFPLSPYFDPIVQKLLDTTNREDGTRYNLRSAAYEALMEMVKNSPKDCYTTVQRTTMTILERLQHVLQMEGHVQLNSDRTQLNDLESLLCATLQSVLRKVTKEDAPHISDAIMGALLHMLSATGAGGGVQEDALLTVSTLIEVLGEGFLKYMDAFNPYFLAGLKNYEDSAVCQAAVGLVGDLCRGLGNKVLPFCDEVMFSLLSSLDNNQVNKDIKPTILSVFGDIALAINAGFLKYLPLVLNLLCQASQTKVDKNDYDMVDYLNSLRESCVEAYTGIIQGIKEDALNNADALSKLQGSVPNMVAFLNLIASDADTSDDVIGASCGLIGDLCTAFGANMVQFLDTEQIRSVLNRGKKLKATKFKTLASWASREIKQLKNA